MSLQFYPTGAENVLMKKMSEGCLHPCSGLVREWVEGSAEQLPAYMAEQSRITLLHWTVLVRVWQAKWSHPTWWIHARRVESPDKGLPYLDTNWSLGDVTPYRTCWVAALFYARNEYSPLFNSHTLEKSICHKAYLTWILKIFWYCGFLVRLGVCGLLWCSY